MTLLCHAALAAHGYRYFRVEEHRLTEQERLEPHEHYRDWLFTRLTDEELTERKIPLGVARELHDS